MIQVVVLLKIKDIEKFKDYEHQAIKIMDAYSGVIISAFTPDDMESSDKEFEEIHILQFPNLEQFHDYQKDPNILSLSSLREQAIEKTKIYVSSVFKSYGQL